MSDEWFKNLEKFGDLRVRQSAETDETPLWSQGRLAIRLQSPRVGGELVDRTDAHFVLVEQAGLGLGGTVYAYVGLNKTNDV